MEEAPIHSLSYDALETAACTLVGRLIFALSRFETNLALYIRDYKGPEHADAVLSKLENSSFHVKLEMLEAAVRSVYGEERACIDAFSHWLGTAHEIRTTRNDLVHGRWGINPTGQQVVNVTGLPGSPNQKEMRYSLQELEAYFGQVDRFVRKFYALSRKWPF
jgi:hypothetical protein